MSDENTRRWITSGARAEHDHSALKGRPEHDGRHGPVVLPQSKIDAFERDQRVRKAADVLVDVVERMAAAVHEQWPGPAYKLDLETLNAVGLAYYLVNGHAYGRKPEPERD